MNSTKIIIAVPRGRIIENCKNILNKTSFSPDPLLFDDNCRKLTFTSSDPNIYFIKVRAFDVCTFVAILILLHVEGSSFSNKSLGAATDNLQ